MRTVPRLKLKASKKVRVPIWSNVWHGRAEYFDVNTENWTKIASYGGKTWIYGYASLYSAGSFFIIGGWISQIPEATDKIYKVDSKTWTWSEVGEMNGARAEHSAIFVEEGSEKYSQPIFSIGHYLYGEWAFRIFSNKPFIKKLNF